MTSVCLSSGCRSSHKRKWVLVRFLFLCSFYFSAYIRRQTVDMGPARFVFFRDDVILVISLGNVCNSFSACPFISLYTELPCSWDFYTYLAQIFPSPPPFHAHYCSRYIKISFFIPIILFLLSPFYLLNLFENTVRKFICKLLKMAVF